MTEAEAVAALDAIAAGDNESAHSEADAILLAVVPDSVAEAWRAADRRVRGFWYA